MQTPNPQVDPNSPQPSPASPNPEPAHPLAPPETPQRHEPPGVPSPLPEQVPGPGTDRMATRPAMPPRSQATPPPPHPTAGRPRPKDLPGKVRKARGRPIPALEGKPAPASRPK